MKRRVLALLLAIVMLIGMMPTAAFADAAEPEESVSLEGIEQLQEQSEDPEEEPPEAEEPEEEPETQEETLIEEAQKEAPLIEEIQGKEDPAEEPQEEKDEPIVTSVTLRVQMEGSQVVTAFDEAVSSDLAEAYGYKDQVTKGVSALDVLVKAHELTFGEDFTKEVAEDFLQISETGWINAIFGVENPPMAIVVNGTAPITTVDKTKVEDGSFVFFGVYEDGENWSDQYVWLETADGKVLDGQSVEAGRDLALVVKGMPAWGGEAAPVAGAKLGTVDQSSGETEALEDQVSDAEGKLTVHISEELAHTTQCFTVLGEKMMGALSLFQVGEAAQGAPDAEVTMTVSFKGVLAQTDSGEIMVEKPVTVKDLDSDGILTYDEALTAAHESYCPDGYSAEKTKYGLTVQKLWGEETTNVLFYTNGQPITESVGAEADAVQAGDKLYCSVNADNQYYADWFTSFNQTNLEAVAGKPFALTLAGFVGMGMDPVPKAVAGVSVGLWKDGTFEAIEGAVTNENGKAELTIAKPGTYYVTANGTVSTEVDDWSNGTKVMADCPIMAPYCVVVVAPAPAVTAKVSYTAQAAGAFLMKPGMDVMVSGDLAENYGYPDAVASGESVSALDVLVQAHIDIFGEDGVADALKVSNTGWITSALGDDTGAFCFLINGSQPTGENGMGYMINQAPVSEGDMLLFGIYQDTEMYLDSYAWLETADGAKLEGETLTAEKPVSLRVKGFHAAWNDAAAPVEDAQIAIVNMEDGTIVKSLGITDEDGLCTVIIPADYVGSELYLTAYGKETEIFMSLTKVNVDSLQLRLNGTGTQDDPYKIATSEDYSLVAEMVAAGHSFAGEYLVQTEDVTLPEGWQPMGVLIDPSVGHINGGKNMAPFSGHLDGGGNTLTVPEGGLPLLGYVKDAYVENLNIYGPRIEGYGLVNNLEGVGLKGNAITIDNVTLKSGTQTLRSGLIGTYLTTNSYSGCSGTFLVTIRNCTAEEGVVIGYDGTQSHIGTFAGRFLGTIENCVSYATVKGVSYVGGIVGSLDQSYATEKFVNCTFSGSVEASGELVGGILGGGYSDVSGYNAKRAVIQNCTVDGTVTGANMVGGIQGGNTVVVQTFKNGPLTIVGNTVTGKITATDGPAVGAIVGFLKGLNANDNISGNTSRANVLQAIGQVEFVDTSAENHESLIGLNYINTASGTAGLPTLNIPWFRWNKAMNRSDDPLGADADALCQIDGRPRMDPENAQALLGGKSTKLKVLGADDEALQNVVWTLADPHDSMYATVTSDGVVKAKTVAAARKILLVAALTGDNTGRLGCAITVLPMATQLEIHQDGKNVTGTTLKLQAKKDADLNLRAVAYPQEAPQEASWKSSNTKILKVSKDGDVSYVAGTGTVTITATAKDGSKKTASVKIQVGTLVQEVTINEPTSKTLRSGKSLTLKAATKPEKPTVSGVTFRLVSSADSAYVTLTAAGKVTAKTVYEPHDVQIIAVSKDAAQVESTPITLKILPMADTSLFLRSEDTCVTYKTLVRNVGDEIHLNACATFIEDGKAEVDRMPADWKSSNPKVAAVDKEGNVTCLKSGSAKITATSGKIKAEVTIKVTSLVETLEITSKTGFFTVASGKSLNLVAKVTKPAKPASKAVTWSILEGSEYAKISASGVVTAYKNLTKEKTITVQALAKDGGGAKVTQQITILPIAQSVALFAQGYERTNTTLVWDMAAENTLQLSAQVYPANASEKVTWKSSNTKIATVDANGMVTFVKSGSVTMAATAADGSGKKASFKIAVVKLMKNLTLENGVVAGGKTLTVKSIIEPTDTTNKKLTWSVSRNDAKITINASTGKLTTKAVKEPVTVTVTATAQDGSGMTDSCNVTVYPATTKVTISAEGDMPKTLAVGQELQLKASCLPENAADIYTWKSSNLKVATVDENGKVTCLKAGTVTMTATAKDGTGKSASVKFTVVKRMKKLTLSDGIIAGGKVLTVKSVIEPADTTNKKLTWTVSQNDAKITINAATGKLATKAVKEPVTVTVTAKAQDGSNLEATCQVTVYPATTKLTIVTDDGSKLPTTLEAGKSLQLKGSSTPENAADAYTWKTNNKLVTVAGGSVTAAPGAVGKTVTITCTAMDGTNKSASVKLKIVAPSAEK